MTCCRRILSQARDANGNLILPNLSILGDVCHALQNVCKNFIVEAFKETKQSMETLTTWINCSKFRTFLRYKADPCTFATNKAFNFCFVCVVLIEAVLKDRKGRKPEEEESKADIEVLLSAHVEQEPNQGDQAEESEQKQDLDEKQLPSLGTITRADLAVRCKKRWKIPKGCPTRWGTMSKNMKALLKLKRPIRVCTLCLCSSSSLCLCRHR